MEASNRTTRRALNDVVRRDKVVDLDSSDLTSSAYKLSPLETVVHATANTASDDWTLYLPPVSMSAGVILSVRATIANSKAITVTDVDDPEWSDLTLDTDEDSFLAYCDGYRWWVLVNDIA